MGWRRVLLGLALGVAAPLAAQDPVPQPAPDQAQPGVDVQTRGPIHEAYAGPVVLNPKPGPIVPKEPPQAIEEVPPDQKPEGEVSWISGYWSYDDERQDYIWVSGIWREPPPGNTWVPGYWNTTTSGYQWTPGYWQQAQQQEIEYLPAPPPSVENGPTTPAIDDQHFWVPGVYEYRYNRYVWRPGYWAAYQPGWVWTPAYYRWTPAGYVYIAGHWDYPMETRGVLFAPVVIDRPVFVARYYTPSVILNVGCIQANLFARPTYGGVYYFGDYYGGTYIHAGYVPWFRPSRVCYDPLFSYYSCYHARTNPGWSVSLTLNFNRCYSDPGWRPPRTFVQQNITNVTINKTTVVNNTTIVNNNVNMATHINNVRNTTINNNSIKMVSIDNSTRNTFVKQNAQLQQAQVQRANFERQTAASNGFRGAPTTPQKVALPQSFTNNLTATKPAAQAASNTGANRQTTQGGQVQRGGAGGVATQSGSQGSTGRQGGASTTAGQTAQGGSTGGVKMPNSTQGSLTGSTPPSTQRRPPPPPAKKQQQQHQQQQRTSNYEPGMPGPTSPQPGHAIPGQPANPGQPKVNPVQPIQPPQKPVTPQPQKPAAQQPPQAQKPAQQPPQAQKPPAAQPAPAHPPQPPKKPEKPPEKKQ
jgi:hypothetical protein